MSQPYAPEMRPCPECGGQRVVHQDVGPEVVAYNTAAAKSWNVTTKSGTSSHLLVRCTNCGYVAFFLKDALPKQK